MTKNEQHFFEDKYNIDRMCQEYARFREEREALT